MAFGAYTMVNVKHATHTLSRTRSRRSASRIRLPTPVNGEPADTASSRPVCGATAVVLIGSSLIFTQEHVFERGRRHGQVNDPEFGE